MGSNETAARFCRERYSGIIYLTLRRQVYNPRISEPLPPSPALPDHVHCLVSLDRSPRRAGLIDTPGLVGWFETMAQPLLQFGTVALDPAPDCRVVRLQAALAEQLFGIAERERVPKGPAHGAKNQLRLRLPPLEDRRPDCLLHDLFRFPAAAPIAAIVAVTATTICCERASSKPMAWAMKIAATAS